MLLYKALVMKYRDRIHERLLWLVLNDYESSFYDIGVKRKIFSEFFIFSNLFHEPLGQ